MQYLFTSTIQSLAVNSSPEQIGEARNFVAMEWRKFNGITVQKTMTQNNSEENMIKGF